MMQENTEMGTFQRHHYIPQFYQRQWTNADEQLAVYMRFNGVVKPRWKTTAQTGYEKNLYSIETEDEKKRHRLETGFMQLTDTLACRALDYILAGKTPSDIGLRSGWTRFIISLSVRYPSAVRALKEHVTSFWKDAIESYRHIYTQKRHASDPPTFEDWVATQPSNDGPNIGVSMLVTLIDHPEVGQYINNMIWFIVGTEQSQFKLLTSDRPVVRTNGLKIPQGQIAIPISPTKVFVAVNNMETANGIRRMSADEIVTQVNAMVVGQAVQYVYASDTTQTRFIQNRMSRIPDVLPPFLGPNDIPNQRASMIGI